MSPTPKWIISFASEKGGTGKTTLAVLLAAHCGHSGKKAVLVDLDLLGADLQVLATEDVPGEKMRVSSIAELLATEAPIEGSKIESGLAAIATEAGRVPLWPGRYQDGPATRDRPELWMAGYFSHWITRRISEVIAKLLHPEMGGFDVVVLDNSPFRTGISGAVSELFGVVVGKREATLRKELDESLRRLRIDPLFYTLMLTACGGKEGRTAARLYDHPWEDPAVRLCSVDVHTPELPTFYQLVVREKERGAAGWRAAPAGASATDHRWEIFNRFGPRLAWLTATACTLAAEAEQKLRAAKTTPTWEKVRRLQREMFVLGLGAFPAGGGQSVVSYSGALAAVLTGVEWRDGRAESDPLAELERRCPLRLPPIRKVAIDAFETECRGLLEKLDLVGTSSPLAPP